MKKWIPAFLFLILAVPTPSLAQKWSFAVLADNRSAYAAYRNVLEEIRDLSVNPSPAFPSADFVLGCGDIGPLAKNDALYKEVFQGKQPPFFPVRGNHETAEDVAYSLERLLPSTGSGLKLQGQGCMNYHVDWKNVRLVALDQYCDFSKVMGGKMALKWLDETIGSATAVDHVFIALHEPLFPGGFTDSGFWDILFKHKDKVRAVLAGHYHAYDRKRFPDENGSIYYINAGNAGWVSHSDNKQTIVEVMIENKKVTFRVVQAPNGSTDFKFREQWESEGAKEEKHGLMLPRTTAYLSKVAQ